MSPDRRLNPPPRPSAPEPGFSSPSDSSDDSFNAGGSPLPHRRPGALRNNRPRKPKTATADETPVPATFLDVFVGMMFLYWETFVLCLVASCSTSYWIFGHTLFPFMIGANGLLTWVLHVSKHKIASPPLKTGSFPRPPKNQMITAVTIALLLYYVYYNHILYTALWNHLDHLAHENGFERAYFHEMVKKNLRPLNSMPGIDERLFEGWWFAKMDFWTMLAVGGWNWISWVMEGPLAWFMWVVKKAWGGIAWTWEAVMEQVEVWRLAFIKATVDFLQACLPAAE
ncbi:hypothetical protein F5X68DRAFT_197360 [Plectosphaerella plurivora]|uniref:Uncharacterized protein n=1 Tax=Plectosphaerella plurivora TaxID=936078 RepID=A0A9P9AGN7_9PEZI|nr:hypothetical protein F5X68DRAFT_197360 [Plectosphaerella plurivora]